MTPIQPAPRSYEKPLRLWPGVAAAAVLVLGRYLIPAIAPSTWGLGLIVGILATLFILVWWVFFSRAAWSERLGALALIAVAIYATSRVVDPSLAGGMMGMLTFVYGIPLLTLALVAGAVAGRGGSAGFRRASLLLAIVLACGALTLLRTDGVTGETGSQFAWRWTPTAEQRLLAQVAEEPTPLPGVAAAPTATAASIKSAAPVGTGLKVAPESSASVPAPSRPEWPGFRGPDRDSVVRGVRINTDWSAAPPVELWRRPIGPGWSSFAVSGDLLYTQEQRGNDEIVSCYRVSTGAPVWRHSDPVRFWESNGGAGPRATPTLHNGRVYTFGATGVVNALDAANGRVIWTRNAATDTSRKVPDWGFASSPLVVNDVVVVAVSGSLVGYEIETGKPRWFGPSHGGSYSSPHQTTIDGVTQVLLLNGAGTTSIAPATGELLWEYAWPGSTITQPALTPDGDILVNTAGGTGGLGTRRLVVKHAAAGASSAGAWSVEERWTSNGLKPYFNDFVVHKGHAFGFDGAILACIDLDDGTRKWKGGRYGSGQLILLADQDLLLVLSEEGELALVGATVDQFKEVARVPALEGKTWNHPVLVGDVLLIRNGEEMAAFRLTRK